ncbi:hypothetical protein FRC03_003372 [Tulasnella sp. 419]|nr:hypothetical protein FRC02_003098 [Tulasnella sp. 418]KAG8942290.1 hypothetical protein FRC03_003372 [Tulasnella sp. 419]
MAWRRRPSNVAGVEGLREDLSVKDTEITCIEFIDDDLVDCGELVLISKVNTTSGPSVSSKVPVNAPVAPRAAAKAATPNVPQPGACTCTICERAKKQANIDEMSEEEQIKLALSRSMDECFMRSYEPAALRRQAVMVN